MGEAAAKEPSMEEILSSIRKIITDDGGSDVSKTAEAASEKKPEIQLAKSEPTAAETVKKPTAVPSAADIKGALAAIQQNVKEAAVESRQVEVVVAEKKPEIAIPAEIITPPEIITPVVTSEPEVEPEPDVQPEPEAKSEVVSSLGSVQEDSISFVDMPSEKEETTDEVEVAPQAETTEIAETAETVSEVPAPSFPKMASSTNSTQDNEPMASTEAEKFKGALMSSNTDQLVNEAFEELRRATMENIDDKTETMLRPMLSEWLDNNLPTLVERLVREEIERVSGSR